MLSLSVARAHLLCGCCCRSMSSVSINSEDCSVTPQAPTDQEPPANHTAGSSSTCTPPARHQQQAGVSPLASPASCSKGPSGLGGSIGAKQQAELAACQVQLGSQFEAVHDYLVRVHRGECWMGFRFSAIKQSYQPTTACTAAAQFCGMNL
jgi:hypothetical protein